MTEIPEVEFVSTAIVTLGVTQDRMIILLEVRLS